MAIDELPIFVQDEVVKYSPHARAIRDVEDEELRSFFYGMSPWQVIPPISWLLFCILCQIIAKHVNFFVDYSKATNSLVAVIVLITWKSQVMLVLNFF